MNDYKAKKKALEQAAWMNQPPHPLPIMRKGTTVQVFRGAGWSKGSVIFSQKDKCVVRLYQGDKTVTVYDRRSIKQGSNE